ncbi:MAG: riboflavin biosynthesis protein RibF [Candidatus Omnitrophica bacterium]|nr:riboflavin biosynthesis protein RibF [Candidatus Omnitrophota bacterium]MDD5653070.1 riboflavin biosynthesis protein RibF [Candidatus Omnitrophota bacterium]
MQIINGISKIKKFTRPVVALGIFDGVHLAHRKIIGDAVKRARLIKGTSLVVTFWPHPRQAKSLYSLNHRLNLIAGLGADAAIVIRFDRKFSQLSAQDFISKILVKKIGAKYIFVGENFRFGRYAAGGVKLLKKFSQIYSYGLKTYRIMYYRGKPVSSTFLRELIRKGNLKTAEKLLLRPVSVLGTVIHGTSLARKFGFPTANLDPHHEVLPPAGVYLVRTALKKKKFNAVCYIGPKPTFIQQRIETKLERDTHIEVHIFDFKGNLYGKDLELLFFKKLRQARKFGNTAALINQVKKDLKTAKTRFSHP